MTKKDRSPAKLEASPNPRPRRRNKKQREPKAVKTSEIPPSEMPPPARNPDEGVPKPSADNSFSVLQSESEDSKEKSTIHPDDSISGVESDEEPSAVDATASRMKEKLKVSPTQASQVPNNSELLSTMMPETNQHPFEPASPIYVSEIQQKLFENKKLAPETTEQETTTRVSSPTQTVTEAKKPPPVARVSKSPVPESPAKSDIAESMEVEPNEDEDMDSKPKAKPSLATTDFNTTFGPNPDGNSNAQEVDVLEKLNESIARNQAMLKRLQDAMAVLQNNGTTTLSDDELHALIDSVEGQQQRDPSAAPSLAAVQGSTSATSSAPTPAPVAPPQVRDPLTELATKKPVYTKIPDPVPKRPFFYRASIRVHINEDAESPQQGLNDAISEVWTVLKSIDDKLIVYPWRQSNHGKFKALSGPQKLPDNKEGINRYFPDAYFRPYAGPMYLNFFIGSNLSYEDLRKEAQFFFDTKSNRSRVGMWYNDLQFEDVVEIGWLFRSTPGMSPAIIRKELLKHTGIQTAIRWKMIGTNSRGQQKEELQIKALHISVCREDANLAKAKFTKLIFAKHRRSHFIGGSPMRMIPVSKQLSLRNKKKCIHYASKQGTFLRQLKSAEMFNIQQIDFPVIGLKGRTLRELILEISRRDAPSKQLFYSVDRSFNKASVRLFYHKDNHTEVYSRIPTLLPYLIFTNPSLESGIRACFSADSNEQTKGVKWDPERKDVITVDDEIFDSFAEWDDSDDDNDIPEDEVQKIMIELAEASGVVLDSSKSKIKPQDRDASSLFSKSTIRSKEQEQNNLNSTETLDDSEDTPKTINRAPTAQTVAMSSLTEAQSNDIWLQVSSLIPNIPENQQALAKIRATFTSSQSVGSSSEVPGPGSKDSGALLR
jgi:hypothetical protein